MSTKHHVRKNRSRSHYKERLQDRGLHKAPTMRGLSSLRSEYPDVKVKHYVEIPRGRQAATLGMEWV